MRSLPRLRRTFAVIAAGALAGVTLTGCASAGDSMCPVTATEMSTILGAPTTAEFTDWKHPEFAPERNERTCIYGVSNSGGGVASVYLQWTPDLEHWKAATKDLKGAGWEQIEDLGTDAWLDPNSFDWVITRAEVTLRFIEDGFAWRVDLTAPGVDERTNDTLRATMATQAEQIARAIAAKSFDLTWWDQ